MVNSLPSVWQRQQDSIALKENAVTYWGLDAHGRFSAILQMSEFLWLPVCFAATKPPSENESTPKQPFPLCDSFSKGRRNISDRVDSLESGSIPLEYSMLKVGKII